MLTNTFLSQKLFAGQNLEFSKNIFEYMLYNTQMEGVIIKLKHITEKCLEFVKIFEFLNKEKGSWDCIKKQKTYY